MQMRRVGVHRWKVLVPMLLLLLLLRGLLLLHRVVSVPVDASAAGSLYHWWPLLVMLWGHRQPWAQRG